LTIDPSNLKVGDVFYGIAERNNVITRKKLTAVIDGETWFRYDKDLITYHLRRYEVLGIVRPQLEGRWCQDNDYDLETQYYVLVEDDQKKDCFILDRYGLDRPDRLFTTVEEAQAKKLELEGENND
jgi:hypothetical protein